MLRPRIIPCLLVKNGGLVKTVQFDTPKYVGDPINVVRVDSVNLVGLVYLVYSVYSVDLVLTEQTTQTRPRDRREE